MLRFQNICIRQQRVEMPMTKIYINKCICHLLIWLYNKYTIYINALPHYDSKQSFAVQVMWTLYTFFFPNLAPATCFAPTDNQLQTDACTEEQKLTYIKHKKARKTTLSVIVIAMLFRVPYNTIRGTLRIMNDPIKGTDRTKGPDNRIPVIPHLSHTEIKNARTSLLDQGKSHLVQLLVSHSGPPGGSGSKIAGADARRPISRSPGWPRERGRKFLFSEKPLVALAVVIWL